MFSTYFTNQTQRKKPQTVPSINFTPNIKQLRVNLPPPVASAEPAHESLYFSVLSLAERFHEHEELKQRFFKKLKEKCQVLVGLL